MARQTGIEHKDTCNTCSTRKNLLNAGKFEADGNIDMRLPLTALATIFVLGGCQPSSAPSDTPEAVETTSFTAEEIEAETAAINVFFEEAFEEGLKFSPIQQTFLGRDTDQDKIDDFSFEAASEQLNWQRANIAKMKEKFVRAKLTPEAQTSWDIAVYQLEQAEAADVFRHNGYVFEQMNAVHTFFPQLLIAFHKVSDAKGMEDYISRISGSAVGLDQLIVVSKANAAKGTRPPYFAFESVIAESQKIITGAPFDDSDEDSAIWADVQSKIQYLLDIEEVDQETADGYLDAAETALLNDWKPAYERLIAWQVEDQVNASEVAQGVTALPDGDAFYNERLAANTTTDMTFDEIHDLGLKEVARLRAEMEAIKSEFGFEGSLPEFFVFLRDTKDDERLYYPDTDEGRQGYIDDATAAIDKIKAVLPDYFGILPKADMEVRRVEPFREQDGAAQHYFAPTPDGSRPGIYYAHLSDMTAMPKRELEVIAYHEGLPGHHMQIAIQQELEGIPTFRTQIGFTAYIEGWALYTEWLAKEMPGTYEDPLSEFGRLGSEMWRAIRLVVDTGLHAKGWSEDEAVAYFEANSAITSEQARSEVRRYLVLPGQATSYKVGMIKIQDLRAEAEAELGEAFDIRGFHDTVLSGGAVPLSILERRVNAWVETIKAEG